MGWFKKNSAQSAFNHEEGLCLDALRQVKDPQSDEDIVARGFVTLQPTEQAIQVLLELPAEYAVHAQTLIEDCQKKLGALPISQSVTVVATAEHAAGKHSEKPLKPAQWNHTPLPHVKQCIAVASGKGGVGKSTVTLQLAAALVQQGKRVGILDADIHGPSMPLMLGLEDVDPPAVEDGMMIPYEAYGIRCMSIGFITGPTAAIMRGPRVTKALHQMARQTQWGAEHDPCDVLLVDMPPGTGDIALSLVQQLPLEGALIVTTPHPLAVIDAEKSAELFSKVDVRLLGVVENMSYLEQADGSHMQVFGEGGGEAVAEAYNTTVLAKLPIDTALQDIESAAHSNVEILAEMVTQILAELH